ncbi:endothelin-converting enzyme homolog [Ornithodoros turicata]|uniref:endothelin-converting enzyme homolog n=1 Tax=Ornithodoros turicata TaxID=34597 RepID=UPI00313962AE
MSKAGEETTTATTSPVAFNARWGSYASFVGVTTLVTICVAVTIPFLIRQYVIGCMDPTCLDMDEALTESLQGMEGGDPCDDFYSYVCTGWKRANPDTPNLFAKLQQRIAVTVIKELLLDDAPDVAKTPTDKVALMFQTCAQVAFNEQNQASSITEFLAQFRLTWPRPEPRDPLDILDLLVGLSLDWGLPVLFHMTIDPYFKKKGFRTVHFSSNPYLTEWFVLRNTLLEKGQLLDYFQKATNIINGQKVDSEIVERLLFVDNRVMTAVMPSLEVRPDFDLQYIKFGDLDDMTGPYVTGREWLDVINRHLNSGQQFKLEDEMFVMNQRLLRLVGVLLARQADTGALLRYVSWQLARHFAPMTSYPLSAVQFGGDRSLTLGYMMGRCYMDVDSVMPYAFGYTFVRRWLSNDVINDVSDMVARIRKVANSSFKSLTWMDIETKREASRKMSTLKSIIGRPDTLASEAELSQRYSYVPDLTGSYFAMALEVRASELRHNKKLINSNSTSYVEVDVPLTLVNAFYMPVYHVIVIPAAILYPPFYAAGFPISLNYGSLGHVVGHEITHAFDPDLGLLDESGVRRDWWTARSRVLFELRLQCLKDIYNKLPWAGGINYGDQALSENFADCGGILKVYHAFKTDPRKVSPSTVTSKPPTILSRYTPDQLFFISSCFKWCANDDTQASGWYSPPRMRCNVPLMNMAEFAEAFTCHPGSRMNPTSKCDFM